ncbi:hypothetical protein HYALB_00009801 [Hymenoscyphus albidus]|uniref:SGNH hydrolase-type esterase domain-containing protein n=1 Tax=Hymenoscyphus albidus TaxID=595503 RepID=A0A9N9Q4A1_9HELO|nr:hypothetical protein HYALB_00009801 [Hymenoscyphus albidus]
MESTSPTPTIPGASPTLPTPLTRAGASYAVTTGDLPAHRPLGQFLLLGDSLTQEAHRQKDGFGMGAELQNAYIRRFDVINRGFSGYNTDHILLILQDIIPTPQQAHIKFLTIWLGANDSNPLGTNPPQHVPLSRFRFNLNDIISNRAVTAHIPGGLEVVLITPPPVDEYLLSQNFTGERKEGRSVEGAREYAEAVKEVGSITGVPVVDIWTAFMRKIGWEESSAASIPIPGKSEDGGKAGLGLLLSDGLHLTPQGYRLVYDELIKVMKERFPMYPPYTMPFSVKVPWEAARGGGHWDVVVQKGDVLRGVEEDEVK